MSDRPTVFVVDDDVIVRDSLAAMVCTMDLLCECYDSADAFLLGYDPAKPGCLLLDLRMPGTSGIELQEKLIQRKTTIPIIIITGHGDVPMSVQSIKRGAVDFLEKPYRPQRLQESIQQAIEIDSKQRTEASLRDEIECQLEELTPNEQGVMQRIVTGLTNKQIAGELDVSLRTIQFRRASLMKKLRVDSRAMLVRKVFSVQGPLSSEHGPTISRTD